LVYSGIGLGRFLVYSGLGLNRFLVYSGLGLGRFHCINKIKYYFSVNKTQNIIPVKKSINDSSTNVKTRAQKRKLNNTDKLIGGDNVIIKREKLTDEA
jgi:hypothetical protein